MNGFWVVRVGRWGPDPIEDQTFSSRENAVAAAKALIAVFADQPGGWSSCPDSHDSGCKWASVPKYEWEILGWDPAATDRWRHCTNGDKFHKERIYVRPA